MESLKSPELVKRQGLSAENLQTAVDCRSVIELLLSQGVEDPRITGYEVGQQIKETLDFDYLRWKNASNNLLEQGIIQMSPVFNKRRTFSIELDVQRLLDANPDFLDEDLLERLSKTAGTN